MTPLAILPVLLPLAAGALLLLLARLPLRLQRLASLLATAALVPLSILLLQGADAGVPMAYRLGDWAAPFGIVLVVDRLAAVMLLLTAAVALPALLYALAGDDAEGPYFHALFQFQLLGINGAFLTGDLFNLFVFFEILLIASYALLLHGATPARTRAAVHVVVLNLVGSALFLFGVGALYAVAGTLNMADLGRVLPQLPAADVGIARAGALLLLVVFALKAALLPLTFWLPQSYAAAAGAVAALFAILTKVGAYAILRVDAQVFAGGALAGLAAPWLLPLGLATFAFGALSTLAARSLGRVATGLVVASMGLLLATLALSSIAGRAAALYYTAHSALASTALFLVVDLIRRQRMRHGDDLRGGEPLRQPALLAALGLAVGLALVGLPPSSGFVGKVLALGAARPVPGWNAVFWAVVLAGTMLLTLALARTGSKLFWKTGPDASLARPAPLLATAAAMLPVLLGLALVAWGGPATRLAESAVSQLGDRRAYEAAVLGDPALIDAQRRSFR